MYRMPIAKLSKVFIAVEFYCICLHYNIVFIFNFQIVVEFNIHLYNIAIKITIMLNKNKFSDLQSCECKNNLK